MTVGVGNPSAYLFIREDVVVSSLLDTQEWAWLSGFQCRDKNPHDQPRQSWLPFRSEPGWYRGGLGGE